VIHSVFPKNIDTIAIGNFIAEEHRLIQAFPLILPKRSVISREFKVSPEWYLWKSRGVLHLETFLELRLVTNNAPRFTFTNLHTTV
jgi:hypothetical protein